MRTHLITHTRRKPASHLHSSESFSTNYTAVRPYMLWWTFHNFGTELTITVLCLKVMVCPTANRLKFSSTVCRKRRKYQSSHWRSFSHISTTTTTNGHTELNSSKQCEKDAEKVQMIMLRSLVSNMLSQSPVIFKLHPQRTIQKAVPRGHSSLEAFSANTANSTAEERVKTFEQKVSLFYFITSV